MRLLISDVISSITSSMDSFEPDYCSNKNTVRRKARTNVERRLTSILLLIFLIALVLVTALAVVVHKTRKDIYKLECLTPGCVEAVSDILKYLDTTVNPCEDFYQFVCGNYLKNTKIPEDKSSISSFTIISDNVRQQLKTIVEEPLQSNAPKHYHILKEMYHMCMNTTAIEADALKTIRAILKDIGGWPVLEGENWKEGTFDWKQLVYTFRKIGFGNNYFIMFYVAIDNKNSSRHIIVLDQPSLGLSRTLLLKGLKEKAVKAYYNYMVDIAVLFGSNRKSAFKEMKDTLNFEIGLANISIPKEQRRNKTALYNLMTVEELQYTYPSINWLEYISNILDISDIEITYEDVVVVSAPQFLKDLDSLLRRTPKRIQSNYIIRREVAAMVPYLTKELRDRQLEYYKVIGGRTEREPRWKECTGIAASSMHVAAGSLYIRKYFKNDVKEHVEKMVTDIRAEFIKMLKDVDWMDEVTRKHALEKAASMTSHIGYPKELLDDKNIEKYYANLELDSDNYLKSIRTLRLFKLDVSYQKLRKPVNKTDWIRRSFPSLVNAFYSPTENSIDFPAGILQGAFFNDERPRYMNYGSIGYIIGHEITHGFDDQGRQFDKDGNLVDWWAEDTKTAFVKKAQCIIDQYGNYTIPEVNLNLNGINTQGENIADNGGIKAAYLTYNRWVARNGREPHLPGLNYTPNQMFWISAAHSRCTKTRKELIKLTVKSAYHSPERFRVIGSFSNSEYFASDFNCPVGTAMNPVDKCKVW